MVDCGCDMTDDDYEEAAWLDEDWIIALEIQEEWKYPVKWECIAVESDV